MTNPFLQFEKPDNQATSTAPTPQSDLDIIKSKHEAGKSTGSTIGDAVTSLGRGAISVPQSLVGVADIAKSSIFGVTGGSIAEALENNDGRLGFRPEKWKSELAESYSDDYKAAQQKFNDADGIGSKTVAALANPSLITNAVVESAPSMISGGVIGRGAQAAARFAGAASKVTPALAGAVGEGAMMAGSQAAAIQAENKEQTGNSDLSRGQAAEAAATGVLGGLLGFGGAKLAQKLGIGDVDVLLSSTQGQRAAAQHVAGMPANSIPASVIKGAISEGFLEELPQSVAEQVIQNLATDKQWNDGLDDAIVMGTLAGMAMGGVGGAAGRNKGEKVPSWRNANQEADKPNPEEQQLNSMVNDAANNGVDLSGGIFDMPNPQDLQAGVSAQEAINNQIFYEQGQNPFVDVPPPLSVNSQEISAEEDAKLDDFGNPLDAAIEPTIAEPKPSEKMGLDPSAGAMQEAAALAVDSGASGIQDAALSVDSGASGIQAAANQVPLTAESTGKYAAQNADSVTDEQADSNGVIPVPSNTGRRGQAGGSAQAVGSSQPVTVSAPEAIPIAQEQVKEGTKSLKSIKRTSDMLSKQEQAQFRQLPNELQQAIETVAEYQADAKLRGENGMADMRNRVPQRVADSLVLLENSYIGENSGIEPSQRKANRAFLNTAMNRVYGLRRIRGWDKPLEFDDGAVSLADKVGNARSRVQPVKPATVENAQVAAQKIENPAASKTPALSRQDVVSRWQGMSADERLQATLDSGMFTTKKGGLSVVGKRFAEQGSIEKASDGRINGLASVMGKAEVEQETGRNEAQAATNDSDGLQPKPIKSGSTDYKTNAFSDSREVLGNSDVANAYSSITPAQMDGKTMLKTNAGRTTAPIPKKGSMEGKNNKQPTEYEEALDDLKLSRQPKDDNSKSSQKRFGETANTLSAKDAALDFMRKAKSLYKKDGDYDYRNTQVGVLNAFVRELERVLKSGNAELINIAKSNSTTSSGTKFDARHYFKINNLDKFVAGKLLEPVESSSGWDYRFTQEGGAIARLVFNFKNSDGLKFSRSGALDSAQVESGGGQNKRVPKSRVSDEWRQQQREKAEAIRNELKRVLGDKAGLVDVVDVINQRPDDLLSLITGRVAGFYERATGKITLVAEMLKPEQAAWVAWHELAHRGVGVAYRDDYIRVMRQANSNQTVKLLADAIMVDRRGLNDAAAVKRPLAVEEALAELYAAQKTGNYGAIKQRYGVEVSAALQEGMAGYLARVAQRLRQVLARILNKSPSSFSDADVFDMLRNIDAKTGKEISGGLNGDTKFSRQPKDDNSKSAYESAKTAGETELTFHQWQQVRTPEFKAWFGDWENDPDNASKVVNEKTGEPMVVYHGTDAEFTVFQPSSDGVYGPGAYMTKYSGDASTYGRNVMHVYARLQNPYVANPGEARRARKDGAKAWSRAIQDKGHDGIVLQDMSVVVAFRPNQIKSATGNSGAFNPDDNDIRYSRREDTKRARPERIKQTRQAIAEVLSEAHMRHIDVTTAAQAAKERPEHARELVNAEGFFDPKTKKITLIADNLPNADVARFVAWHELGHRGVDVAGFNAWKSKFKSFYNLNPTFKALTDSIQQQRSGYNSKAPGNTNIFMEEAAVELYAAHKTGNYARLQEKYGVDVPKAARADIGGYLRRLANNLKRILAKAFGLNQNHFSDADIYDLLNGIDAATGETLSGSLNEEMRFSRSGNTQADGVKFSMKDTPDVMAANTSKAIKGVSASSVAKALSGGRKAADLLKVGLQFLGRRQIVDIYGRLLPNLKTYSDIVQQMDAEKHDVSASADKLADTWGKLKDGDALAALMHEATLAQIDADPKADNEQQKKLAGIQAALDKADNDKPKGEAMIAEADAAYRDVLDAYKQAAKLAQDAETKLEKLEEKHNRAANYNDSNAEMKAAFEASREARANEKHAHGNVMANRQLKTDGQNLIKKAEADIKRLEIAEAEMKEEIVKAKVLQGKFNKLSPDAKDVYRQARDDYKAHYDQVREAIKERIERSAIKSARKYELAKKMDERFMEGLKGVYFPLARFGDYVVVVKNEDGKTVHVSREETMGAAISLRETLLKQYPKAKGFDVGNVQLTKEYAASQDAVSRGFMSDLFNALDEMDLSDDQYAQLEDSFGQLYLASMPDLSWAKHGIHRKGTAGFSNDARRAYAQNMLTGGNHLAKIRHSDRLQDELDKMQEYADENVNKAGFDQPKAQRVINEMVKRHDNLMNPNAHALSSALTSIGFVYYLGLSPASALVNLSQTAMVAMPVMGAKWGFAKTNAALLRASKETMMGKNDITSYLNDDEAKAYEQAVRDGTIDVSQAHDLAGIADGQDAKVMWKMRGVMKMASFMFHHAERFNRQATFIAAYRLAKDAGADSKTAFEQAKQATYDGHFDYATSNRARLLQGNYAKVIFLFKQYSQNMIYTLARHAYQSVKGESPEVRREARKVFAALMTMHAAAAGVLGLPFVSTLLAVASAIGGSDDEPWDAEDALRNMLAETFGNTAGEVMAKGFSRLTPWDISGRVGLDNLIIPDVQEGLEGGRYMDALLSGLAGPVVGMFKNVGVGAGQMLDGDYQRGLETVMPVSVRNPLKALRLGVDGAVDKSGVVVLDEVDGLGLLGQLGGFSPSEVRRAFEGKAAVYRADRALSIARQDILTQYAKALMEGDSDAVSKARERADKFNLKNPTRRITYAHAIQSMKNRQRRINEAKDGVYLSKNRQDARAAGRFAFDENDDED